ncbi:hypothetical protein MYCTH_2130157 [Thermothelomyces thermophilus ATCC 42464]|uniref:BZIP domain-containing protein n=1 Tax=Thermothelomyces thermophilus (strain ATCC 42464 / BCRC 31852 / DSM 1799) TaxID=573729 RepID=G2QM35_THET4|nr:uncharacterized protein MYCTH_2130157 [Thermothelomyces thermophilus ATCC 42464]AEO61015.1 hypothetical protein MYCTH_2130157 [Thermothelomyces thermophilus ATCC 42464]
MWRQPPTLWAVDERVRSKLRGRKGPSAVVITMCGKPAPARPCQSPSGERRICASPSLSALLAVSSDSDGHHILLPTPANSHLKKRPQPLHGPSPLETLPQSYNSGSASGPVEPSPTSGLAWSVSHRSLSHGLPPLQHRGKEIVVPVDVRRGSKAADDKRRGNAAALARFRKRKKERERSQQEELQKLENANRELESRNKELAKRCQELEA